MNYDWVLAKVTRYRDLVLAYENTRGNSDSRGRDAIYEEIDQRVGAVQAIAEKVRPSVAKSVVLLPSRTFRDTKGPLFSLNMLIGEIRDAAEIAENFKADCTASSADELDPMVWKAAASLWATEHYRQAVQTAATTVHSKIQQLVGRRDKSDSGLMNEVFGTDKPVPGNRAFVGPVIRATRK